MNWLLRWLTKMGIVTIRDIPPASPTTRAAPDATFASMESASIGHESDHSRFVRRLEALLRAGKAPDASTTMNEIENQIRLLLSKKAITVRDGPGFPSAEIREEFARKLTDGASALVSALGLYRSDGLYCDMKPPDGCLPTMFALNAGKHLADLLSTLVILGIDIRSLWEAIIDNELEGASNGFDQDGTAKGQLQTITERIEMILTMQASFQFPTESSEPEQGPEQPEKSP